MKPYANYFPDTNSLILVIDDQHGQTESEEVAENVIAVFDAAENRLVAVEVLNGAREAFAELLAKASGERSGSPIKSNTR